MDPKISWRIWGKDVQLYIQKLASRIIYLQETEFETDKGDEHESKQNTTSELHPIFWLIVSQSWNSSKQTSSFDT